MVIGSGIRDHRSIQFEDLSRLSFRTTPVHIDVDDGRSRGLMKDCTMILYMNQRDTSFEWVEQAVKKVQKDMPYFSLSMKSCSFFAILRLQKYRLLAMSLMKGSCLAYNLTWDQLLLEQIGFFLGIPAWEIR